MTHVDARPGCANLSLFSRECKAACLTNGEVPSLVDSGKIASPSALEGPEVQLDAAVCLVANNSEAQEACTAYTPRSQADDARDLNI